MGIEKQTGPGGREFKADDPAQLAAELGGHGEPEVVEEPADLDFAQLELNRKLLNLAGDPLYSYQPPDPRP